MKVLVRHEGHVLLHKPLRQAVTGEDLIGQQRRAAIGDAVAHIDQPLVCMALTDCVALAPSATDFAGVAPVITPHQRASPGREDGVVGNHLKVPEAQIAQHLVNDAAKACAHHHQTVPTGLGKCHQIREAGACARLFAHQGHHVIVGSSDSCKLGLHGLLHGHFTRPQGRFDLVPETRAPMSIDDHVQRVAQGDRAVEVHGDEERCHDARGYQRDTIHRVPDDADLIDSPRPVFIHGAGRTPASWGPQLARFEGALAVALPGHPDGEPLEGAANMAQWVVGEIEEIPGPLVMVGHSLGGAVVLEVALQRPDLVAGLVLVSTGARLPVPDHALERIEHDFEGECARMVEQSWLHHNPDLIRRGTGSVISMGPHALRADYLSARGHDVRGLLDQITVPALVLSGQEDPLVPTWLSQELADGLPDATMVIIPGAAHVPQLERADAVDLLVAAWLARLELLLSGDDD